MSATAAILSVSRSTSFSSVHFDARGPVLDLFRVHQVVSQARVFVAPLIDVLQILLARDDRAVADLVAGITGARFVLQLLRELVDDPRRNLRALRRVDEAEQDDVCVESSPE